MIPPFGVMGKGGSTPNGEGLLRNPSTGDIDFTPLTRGGRGGCFSSRRASFPRWVRGESSVLPRYGAQARLLGMREGGGSRTARVVVTWEQFRHSGVSPDEGRFANGGFRYSKAGKPSFIGVVEKSRFRDSKYEADQGGMKLYSFLAERQPTTPPLRGSR